jgi:DNA-binding beta-propeller fold protein YncE
MRFLSPICVLFVTACVLASPSSGQGALPRFHKTAEVVLGGEGGWDYLTFDSGTGRIYVSRSTRVDVVDPDAGRVVGTISDTPGVHGVALAPKLHKGFTSNGRDGTVGVFDLDTLGPMGRIRAGSNPDAILYDPATDHVFAFNGGSHDVTIIGARSAAVMRTLPLGGKPEFAAADGDGNVYVNIEDTAEIVAIDSRHLNVEARWPLKGCEAPTGLAMDVERHRLFVGCSNKVMTIVDAKDGRVIATLPIGAGCDATAFDPQASLAFSSNGDGTLTVIGRTGSDGYAVVQNVPTKPGARTMALDPKRQRIYLVTADYGPRPAATPEQPRPRPAIVPGSFTLLVVER